MLVLYKDSNINDISIVVKYIKKFYSELDENLIYDKIKYTLPYKYLIISRNQINFYDEKEYNVICGKKSIDIKTFKEELEAYENINNSVLIKITNYIDIIKLKEIGIDLHNISNSTFNIIFEKYKDGFLLISNKKFEFISNNYLYELLFKNNIKEFTIIEYLRYLKLKNICK